jgi:hypothetical protein
MPNLLKPLSYRARKLPKQLTYQDWNFAISFLTVFPAYSIGIQWCRSARFGGIAFSSLERRSVARRRRLYVLRGLSNLPPALSRLRPMNDRAAGRRAHLGVRDAILQFVVDKGKPIEGNEFHYLYIVTNRVLHAWGIHHQRLWNQFAGTSPCGLSTQLRSMGPGNVSADRNTEPIRAEERGAGIRYRYQ